MKSQNQEILEFISSGYSITPLDALERFGCNRLAARICDLRGEGYEIVTTTVKQRSPRTGKMVRYAAYSMGDV